MQAPAIIVPGATQPFPDPIPGIIPFGTLTLFAGAPGAGKTTLLAMFYKAWRDGEPIFGHPTHTPPGGLFYISADRGGADAAKWFALAGFPDVPRYSLADDPTIDLQNDLKDWKAPQLLRRCLDQLSPPPGSIVSVDPGSPLFIWGDPNRTKDVARSMMVFSREGIARQITLIVSAHFSKQRSDEKARYARPQDRIAGSTSFAGFTDTQMYLEVPRGPKSPHHTFGWVPRHAEQEAFNLMRDPTTGLFVPADLFTEMDRRQQAWEVIPDERTASSIVCKRISVAVGVNMEAAHDYLKSLVSDGRVTRCGKGFYQRKRPS